MRVRKRGRSRSGSIDDLAAVRAAQAGRVTSRASRTRARWPILYGTSKGRDKAKSKAEPAAAPTPAAVAADGPVAPTVHLIGLMHGRPSTVDEESRSVVDSGVSTVAGGDPDAAQVAQADALLRSEVHNRAQTIWAAEGKRIPEDEDVLDAIVDDVVYQIRGVVDQAMRLVLGEASWPYAVACGRHRPPAGMHGGTAAADRPTTRRGDHTTVFRAAELVPGVDSAAVARAETAYDAARRQKKEFAALLRK